MGIMECSLLSVLQDLYHQPYFGASLLYLWQSVPQNPTLIMKGPYINPQ